MSKLLILVAVVIGATLGGQLAGAFGTFIGALVGHPASAARSRSSCARCDASDDGVTDDVAARP